jgi:hypothetical protein
MQPLAEIQCASSLLEQQKENDENVKLRSDGHFERTGWDVSDW